MIDINKQTTYCFRSFNDVVVVVVVVLCFFCVTIICVCDRLTAWVGLPISVKGEYCLVDMEAFRTESR